MSLQTPQTPNNSTHVTTSTNVRHEVRQLRKTNPFLKDSQLSQLTQSEIDHWNSPLTIKEIELIIKSLPKKKYPSPDSFAREFYQTIKEKLTSVLHSLLLVQETFPNSFQITSITIILKPKTVQNKETIDQYPSWKKLQKSLTKSQKLEILNQQNLAIHKNNYTP